MLLREKKSPILFSYLLPIKWSNVNAIKLEVQLKCRINKNHIYSINRRFSCLQKNKERKRKIRTKTKTKMKMKISIIFHLKRALF